MTILESIGLNIATILGVVGILAGIMAYSTNVSGSKKDSQKMKRNFLSLITVVGIGLFLIPAFGLGLANLTAPLSTNLDDIQPGAVIDTTGNNVPTSSSLKCPSGSIEDATVTFSGVDKFSDASAGTNHRYRIDGAPAKVVANAGTDTASGGATIEVLWGNETDATYFGEKTNTNLGCFDGAPTLKASLVKNGTVTMDIFNSDKNKQDSNVNNQTFAIADQKNLQVRIQGPNKAGYPHGALLTLELNASDYDEQNIVATSVSGITVTKVSYNPSNTLSALSSVDNVRLSWEIGPIVGTEEHLINVFFDVDDNLLVAPGVANEPVFKLRPLDYYIDNNNGGVIAGPSVEDENNAQTFLASTTATVQIGA